MGIAILIIIAIIIIVIIKLGTIGAKSSAEKQDKQAEIDAYYNCTRWRSVIDATDKLDKKVTNEIVNAFTNRQLLQIGELDETFDAFYLSNLLVFASDEQKDSLDQINFVEGEPYQTNSILSKFYIQPKSQPVVISSKDNKKRGMVLYIFPKIVLVFVTGPEKTVFIGAYKMDVLTLSYREHIERKEVQMSDSHYDIAYNYKEYSPIDDAEIHTIRWFKQNADGKRSRRGSLLAEHNPLIFDFSYAMVFWNIGKHCLYSTFSNKRAVKEMCSAYRKYIKNIDKERDTNIEQ